MNINQTEYIAQLENTIGSLTVKLESISLDLEAITKNKMAKVIMSWREDSILLNGMKRQTKVYIYGCSGVVDYAWLKKTSAKTFFWEFGKISTDCKGHLNTNTLEESKHMIESMFSNSVDWMCPTSCTVDVKKPIKESK